MEAHVVIGGGPSGLMAAEVLSARGERVRVFEGMPSIGRKFLMAGRGGLNLTHSEPLAQFLGKYGARSEWLGEFVRYFTPDDLVAWATGLGQETFVGSSGRVFPKVMKASPLLRAWLRRLETQAVEFHVGQIWCGWDEDGSLVFRNSLGELSKVKCNSVILALGGASWPKFGSRADWVSHLEGKGVRVAPFRPANCGFNVAWTDFFREKFAGSPLQGASYSFGEMRVRGESVISHYGIEGGAIYALSSALRDELEVSGEVSLSVDLRPEMSTAEVLKRVSRHRGGDSLSNFLRKSLSLSPVAIGLAREGFGAGLNSDPSILARQIKAVPLRLTGAQGLARAISSAGGIEIDELTPGLMLKKLPGVHVAGEMVDWEAPTGGYLLQACFSMGVAAALGALSWSGERDKSC